MRNTFKKAGKAALKYMLLSSFSFYLIPNFVKIGFGRFALSVIGIRDAVRRCKLVLKPAELIAIGDQASLGLTRR